jgi:hypothetical protein
VPWHRFGLVRKSIDQSGAKAPHSKANQNCSNE